MTKILLVHPGPDFSVADVFRGWYKALVKLGHHVIVYNTNERLAFFGRAMFEDHGKEPCTHCGQFPLKPALPDPLDIAHLSVAGVLEDCYKYRPDIVFFVSGFYQSGEQLRLIRARGHKIVMLHTESPYQDDEQLQRGQWAHLNLLNDPSNLERWGDLGSATTAYVPHSYDPDVHYSDDSAKELDFSFIGTAFKSRCEFFSQVLPPLAEDGSVIGLGGNAWAQVEEEHKPLLKFLAHPPEACVDNDETARVYRISKTGINFYRRESEDSHQGEGVAMGPREIEMAASGLFFARDPRPESDETFPMLPSFSTPAEALDILRWYIKHDEERTKAAELAQAAVMNFTFDDRAADVMRLMERTGIL